MHTQPRMALPRKIKPKNKAELECLSVARLLEYRRRALSLEKSQISSDYRDLQLQLDPEYIWFKDDPRWKTLTMI